MKRTIFSFMTVPLVLFILTSCAGSPRPLTAAELLSLGERYLLELNFEQALVHFTTLIEIEPMNPRGYIGAAAAHVGLEQTGEAVAVLRRGLERLPGNVEIEAMLDELLAEDESAHAPDADIANDDPPEQEPAPTPTPTPLNIPDYITIRGAQHSTALTFLNLGEMNLTDGDIEPLRYMVNLRTLELRGNQISDITPLSGLINLQFLNLHSNQVSDLMPLVDLTNLIVLDLADNQVSDLMPLAGLTNLTWLSLFSNQISDLTPISGLPILTMLQLNDNPITDWSPVAHVEEVTGRP